MTSTPEISIYDIWRILVNRRWVILITILAALLLSIAYVLVAEPVYRAQVVMIEVDHQDASSSLAALNRQFGGLASLAGIQVDENSLQVEALATIRSRAFIADFIDSLDLLPYLFPDRWDDESNNWIDEDDDRPTLAAGYEKFREKIMSVSVNNDGLVTVSIDLGDRNRAAEWANELVARLNALMRRRSIEEAEGSLAYLNAELEKTSVVELRQAIFGLVEAQVQKIMLANVREEYVFRVIDPAQPPEPGDVIKPKRMLMVLSSLVVGTVLGLFLAFFLHSLEIAQLRERNNATA